MKRHLEPVAARPVFPACHFLPLVIAAAMTLANPITLQAFNVTGTAETTAEGFENGLLISDDFQTGDGFVMSEAPLSVPGTHIPSFSGPPVGRASLVGGSSSAAFFATEASGLFFDPSNLYDIDGMAEWNAVITHTGTSQTSYELQLSVNTIELRLFDAVDGPTWTAGYTIFVGVEGSVIWSSQAHITGNMNAITLNTSGTLLNPTPVNLPTPGNPKPAELIGYDFGSHGETIHLGDLSAQGETLEIGVFVHSYIVNVPDFETGAYSIIGDPLDPLSGNGVNAFIIPEPRAYGLVFGTGVLLLLLFRKTRRSEQAPF